MLATDDSFTPVGVESAPDKIGTETGEDAHGKPLSAAFLSVRPAVSPARSLRAYLRKRMEQPITITDNEYRFPGAVRAAVAVSLAIGSWAVILGGGWMIARYIFR
ncbi:hypothetical protein [Sphingomonas sp. Root710]|uniref:hypothetical protein n=1 Tax=Sphingomonas sp. Root710 TaxID=1736594 RepID=UPI001F2C2E22|nr:hypothetical protein [Sphingomonas sp. Root710]